MKKLILLFIVPAILAFKAQFKYGCGSESCTYKFVIPEVVAHYVDPKVLSDEVTSLKTSITVLEKLLADMPDGNTTAFDEAFQPAYNTTDGIVTSVSTSVNDQKDSFATALDNSVKAKTVAECLAKQTNCFQSGNYSDDCGKLCDA